MRHGGESVQRVKVNLHVRIKLAREFAHESPFILKILKQSVFAFNDGVANLAEKI